MGLSAALHAGDRLAKRLAERHYYTARAYHRLRFSFSRSNKGPKVLVYQMGKVGSSTVVTSLRASELRLPVYHIHFLTDAGVAYAERIYRETWHRRPAPVHLWHSKFLRKEIIRRDPVSSQAPPKWRVITLVRDPIAHLASSFFEVLRSQSGYDWTTACQSSSMEAVTEELMERFIAFAYERTHPYDWFEDELKPVFGFDVFSESFSRATGYDISKRPGADLLVLKTERLDKCGPQALCRFLGIESCRLVPANQSHSKGYRDLYRRFLTRVSIPADLADRYYETSMVRHFYEDDEIATMRVRWCRRRARLGD